jgi:hypothetical protein
MSGYHLERVRFRAQGDTRFLPPTASETIIADSDLYWYWRLGESAAPYADSGPNGFTATDGGAGTAMTHDVANANISDDDGGVQVNPIRPRGYGLWAESASKIPYRGNPGGTDLSQMFNSANPFTIMGWFYPKSAAGAYTAADYHPLFTCGAGSSSGGGGSGPGTDNNDIWIDMRGTPRVRVVHKSTGVGENIHAVISTAEGGVGTDPQAASVTSAYDTWHHVAWSFSGTVSKLYLNGSLDTTWADTYTNVANYSRPTYLGYGSWYDNFRAQFFGLEWFYQFNGYFDEWAGFTAVKSADFIATVAAG